MNESFQKQSKNNVISQILFSWDWHNKSTLHCNGFNSLGRTTTFEFSFLQHSISILLAFFSAKSANSTVFRMRILFTFFCAKSANSTVFRIPILLETEFFLCEAYCFRKTSQTSDAQKNTPLHYRNFKLQRCLTAFVGIQFFPLGKITYVSEERAFMAGFRAVFFTNFKETNF